MLLAIFVGGSVLTLAYYAYSSYTKPKVSLSLSATSLIANALAPGENIVKRKSYQEGKLIILTIDYTIQKALKSDDIEIWLHSKGNEIHIAAVEGPGGMPIPKKNIILSSIKPGRVVFDVASIPNKPNTPLKANFYIYFREKGTLTAQAEVRAKSDMLGESDPLTINVN